MDHVIEPKEPLLLKKVPLTYSELALLLRRVNFDPSGGIPKILSPDLMRKVVSFLIVKPVIHNNVQAIGCSSHDERHPLSACLDPDEDSWWVSGARSMPLGRGREYVEFQLANTLCRLTSVSIKIPPIPRGPLSVKEFELLAPVDVERTHWISISKRFDVRNVTGFQRFAMVPTDVQHVRLVCWTNQISTFLSVEPVVRTHYEAVGYYAVRFD